MTKVSFLISNSKQACDLARIIYQSIVDKCSQNWYYCLKLAWIYLKGVKKGVLTFRISETETISVRIEKVIGELITDLTFFVKDTVSGISYTLFPYQLV